MSLDYDTIKNWPFAPVRHTYSQKDSMLYALSLGYGADPTDQKTLRFVYEKDLQAVPTMAVILGDPGFWVRDPRTGIDWVQALHGEQTVTLHQPLPAAASVIGKTRVISVSDKGAGKGALVVFETAATLESSGAPLATVSRAYFCRGDGGYSAKGQPSDAVASAPATTPLTPPDAVCDLPTRPDMALLYRLSSDMNPLHADPAIAREAGFDRPILHGLGSFGVAGHAVLKTCCDYDAARLKRIDTRFTAPVFPGETIRTELWKRGRQVFFRARVLERDLVVMSNGYAEIAEPE